MVTYVCDVVHLGVVFHLLDLFGGSATLVRFVRASEVAPAHKQITSILVHEHIQHESEKHEKVQSKQPWKCRVKNLLLTVLSPRITVLSSGSNPYPCLSTLSEMKQ